MGKKYVNKQTEFYPIFFIYLRIFRHKMSMTVMSRICTLRMVTGRQFVSNSRAVILSKSLSTEAVPLPDPKHKVYSEKIENIVDQIGALSLMEVSDLNALLKQKFNISDAPVMMAGSVAGSALSAAPAQEEEEEPEVVAVQTSFTLQLESFDAGKKVALIKEIKSNVEGMNLVQAKKFVESAPAVVKADLAKDEAEKMKKALEAVGAVCKIV